REPRLLKRSPLGQLRRLLRTTVLCRCIGLELRSTPESVPAAHEHRDARPVELSIQRDRYFVQPVRLLRRRLAPSGTARDSFARACPIRAEYESAIRLRPRLTRTMP